MKYLLLLASSKKSWIFFIRLVVAERAITDALAKVDFESEPTMIRTGRMQMTKFGVLMESRWIQRSVNFSSLFVADRGGYSALRRWDVVDNRILEEAWS